MKIRLLIAKAYVRSPSVNLLAMLNLRAQHDVLAYHVSDKALQWHMLQPGQWQYIVIHCLVNVGIFIAAILIPRPAAN